MRGFPQLSPSSAVHLREDNVLSTDTLPLIVVGAARAGQEGAWAGSAGHVQGRRLRHGWHCLWLLLQGLAPQPGPNAPHPFKNNYRSQRWEESFKV